MAADTFSTDGVGVILMGTGNDNNTWGSNQNTNVFQVLADAVTNTLTNTVTGGTLDLSGSPPPAASSQTRYAGLIFNGTLLSNQLVVVPNLNKWWLVKNATAGSFTLKLKTTSGTASTAIPQNSGWQIVQCDGANGIVVWPLNTVQLQMPDGSVSAPPYSNVNETNTGWYRAGTQDYRLAIAGVDVLQVTGGGASSPSVLVTPNTISSGGSTVVPSGVEVAYAGLTEPVGWYFSAGQAKSRTTDSTLFAAITTTATGNTHSNTTLDNLSTDLRNLGVEGAAIEGTGIPTGTTISSVNSATSLTLSQAAISTNSGITIRILPYGQGDASTTFNLPDRRGRAIAGRDNMGGTAANRLTGLTNGILGTKLSATGGEEAHTLTTAQLPAHTHTITDPGHTHTLNNATGVLRNTGSGNLTQSLADSLAADTISANTATTGITATDSAGSGSAANVVQPTGIANYIIKR